MARERKRSRQRRAEGRRGSREAEYRNRAARRRLGDPGPLPALHSGEHPALERARELVPDPRRGTHLAWWLEELAADLRSEAALAILEGRDPVEAVRRYRAREHTWARLTAPIVDNFAAQGLDISQGWL